MKPQIHALTGLRGLAALIVFVSHSANQGMLPGFLGNGFGQIGVMIFFVLSGFLMGHLYIDKGFTQENLKSFTVSRVGRVFPLFIIVVLSSWAINVYLDLSFHYRIDSFSSLALALLFIKAPNELWTIPIEIQFYAFFILLWWLKSISNNYFTVLFLWVFSLVPSVVFWGLSGKVLPLFSTYSTAFLMGIVTSACRNSLRGFSFVRKFCGRAGVIFFLFLFVNLPALRLEYDLVFSQDFFARTWLDPINWVLVLGLFFSVMMEPKALSFLSGRVFLFLGKISFAFYLFHYPILIAVNEFPIGGFLKFSVSLLLTLLLSLFSLHTIEGPANKWIKKLLYLNANNFGRRGLTRLS